MLDMMAIKKNIKGTKLNLAVNEKNIILNYSIMSGNRNDVIGFKSILKTISLKSGKSWKTKKKNYIFCYPKSLYADKGYDSKDIRKYLRNRDIISNIPTNKRNRKHPKKGRPIQQNSDYVSVRGGVERVFGWLKMRYKKLQVRNEINSIFFTAFIDLSIFFHNYKILR